jgi:homoserine dehydrogenase
MKIQLVGFGNVAKNLVGLIREKEETLELLGFPLEVVSISDSKGTAINREGLDLDEILKHKKTGLSVLNEYVPKYSAIDSIGNIGSDVVVELTPSTFSGEPGLSHIKKALMMKKNVVTANKSPMVMSFKELVELAQRNSVRLLYEATVAAHLPVFCMVDSCFEADELLSLKGILNATTNFMIGEMEKGRTFEGSLKRAVKEGWSETEYADDVDGIDSARKVVILANSFFGLDAKLKDVKVKGIRDIEELLKKAKRLKRKVKLLCEIVRRGNTLKLSVGPRILSPDDPLNTVNNGDMGLKFSFRKSKQVFVSAEFHGPEQTAQAVLNDIVKICRRYHAC